MGEIKNYDADIRDVHDRIVNVREELNKKIDDVKDGLNEKLDLIKDNHLAHLAADINDVKMASATQGEAVDWLKKAFWIVATASIGSAIAAVANLLLSR